MHMYGVADNVDPDEVTPSRAVLSGSALYAETYLPKYFDFFQYCHRTADKVEIWEYNVILKYFFLLFNENIDPLIRTFYVRWSNEGSQQMLLWRNIQNISELF